MDPCLRTQPSAQRRSYWQLILYLLYQVEVFWGTQHPCNHQKAVDCQQQSCEESIVHQNDHNFRKEQWWREQKVAAHSFIFWAYLWNNAAHSLFCRKTIATARRSLQALLVMRHRVQPQFLSCELLMHKFSCLTMSLFSTKEYHKMDGTYNKYYVDNTAQHQPHIISTKIIDTPRTVFTWKNKHRGLVIIDR